MSARLLGALDRLPPWARRALMIAVPLLLLAVLVAAFALAPTEAGEPLRAGERGRAAAAAVSDNRHRSARSAGAPRRQDRSELSSGAGWPEPAPSKAAGRGASSARAGTGQRAAACRRRLAAPRG